MAQYEMNLREYWLIVRRRRFIIVVSTVLVTLLSFWFSKQRVPVYDSTASVRYEQATSLTGLLVEVLAGSQDDPFVSGRLLPHTDDGLSAAYSFPQYGCVDLEPGDNTVDVFTEQCRFFSRSSRANGHKLSCCFSTTARA